MYPREMSQWQAIADAATALDSLERQAEELSHHMAVRTKGRQAVQDHFGRCKRDIQTLKEAFPFLEAELVERRRSYAKAPHR